MGNSLVDKIKEIRAETSAGVMDVKRALEESGGDVEEAKRLLTAKGIARAVSKGERSTPEGLVHAYIHAGGRVGVLIEVNCETDFVARTDVFKELVHDLAMQVAAMNPASVADLLDQDFVKDPAVKVGDLVKSIIAKTGENIVVARFVRYALDSAD